MAPQRIGVYGGTFDPIHHGHLAMAADVRRALQLDQVLFVVAAQQPLKTQGHGATAQQRLAMVRLACADDAGFLPSDIEIQRPPPSYTVETLRKLRASYGVAAKLWFILGADALADMHRWHGTAEIITLVRLAAVERPGTDLDLAALEQRLPGISAQIDRIEGPRLDIASSELRERRAAGRPIRYQLPDVVLNYIEEQSLYPADS